MDVDAARQLAARASLRPACEKRERVEGDPEPAGGHGPNCRNLPYSLSSTSAEVRCTSRTPPAPPQARSCSLSRRPGSACRSDCSGARLRDTPARPAQVALRWGAPGQPETPVLARLSSTTANLVSHGAGGSPLWRREPPVIEGAAGRSTPTRSRHGHELLPQGWSRGLGIGVSHRTGDCERRLRRFVGAHSTEGFAARLRARADTDFNFRT